MNFKKIMDILKTINIKHFFKRKEYIIGAALIVIVGSTVIMSHIKKEDNRYTITTNKAEKYFYAADYDKAIEEYKKISQKDKQKPIWDAKIAEVYSVKGDIENSRKYLKQAKGKQSKDIGLLNYIVFTEFMDKDYQMSMEDGEKCLKENPKDRQLIKTMFIVYMANDKLDMAKILLNSYPKDDNSAYDKAEYARMLMLLGQWQDGFRELREAWSIDKDEYKIYDVLAQTALYNKDILLQQITELSNKNPKDIAYKMWLAKIYSLSEDTADQSYKILNDLKYENTGKIENKLIQASVLQYTKQSDKADELINEVIKENKDDYRVLHTAAWFYLNKKDIDKAMEYCKESIVKNKNYPDNYGFLMPEILKAQGKSLEGEPYFRTAMIKEPYNYNIMLNIANYYWYTTKNTDKALEYFKFAEIVKPTDSEIKYNMALIYLANNKKDEAVKLLQSCIKISDSIPKYHRTLGTIYMTDGKNQEAIKEIRYAYSADEKDIMTLNNAGCYYINVDSNLQRGLYNLQKAYEGINGSTDKYTKDTIIENYNKVKELMESYENGKANDTLKIPEFILFY